MSDSDDDWIIYENPAYDEARYERRYAAIDAHGKEFIFDDPLPKRYATLEDAQNDTNPVPPTLKIRKFIRKPQ